MKRILCIFALAAIAMADPDLQAELKKSNDQFTAKMFQEVAKSEGDKSYVLSAFSVLSPLGQLALASVGKTHDEILKTIGFQNDTILKEAFSDLNARLRTLKGVDLEFANKIYVRDDYSLDDQFAAMSKEIFQSEVESINFKSKEKAAAEINEWVEEHTHKLIKNLVKPDSLDEKIAAMLVNAIYFKGKWNIPFRKYLTYERTFQITKDRTKSLLMMHQTNSHKYAKNAEFDAQFLELEFVGNEASLVVALPNRIDGIDDLIEKFKHPSALNKALKVMKPTLVTIYLPKFKIETTINLVNVLEKMDIKELFQSKHAKLYNLLKKEKDLYVSSATQKAYIDINEEGAEAAAANKVIMMLGESLQEYINIPQFRADHPFLFFIMERDNVLFSGAFRS